MNSILGNDPDNPLSGETPTDTFGSNEPVGLSDQGDSIADDDAAAALAQEDPDTVANEAVRDPAPADEPVNDTGAQLRTLLGLKLQEDFADFLALKKETNDIVIHALQHLPSDVFVQRCKDQFDRLYLEGADNARVMALSIHPYITGVPHRIRYLEEVLDYVISHEGVALMTASEIGDWYRNAMRST